MIQRFEALKAQLIEEGYDEENIRLKTAIVFFANPYHIAEGGQTNEGVSVSYAFAKSLEPFRAPNTKAIGIRTGKVSFAPECITYVKAAPAFYDFLCVDVMNGNGQMVTKPMALEFKGYIKTELEPEYPPAPVGAPDKKQDKKVV